MIPNLDIFVRQPRHGARATLVLHAPGAGVATAPLGGPVRDTLLLASDPTLSRAPPAARRAPRPLPVGGAHAGPRRRHWQGDGQVLLLGGGVQCVLRGGLARAGRGAKCCVRPERSLSTVLEHSRRVCPSSEAPVHGKVLLAALTSLSSFSAVACPLRRTRRRRSARRFCPYCSHCWSPGEGRAGTWTRTSIMLVVM